MVIARVPIAKKVRELKQHELESKAWEAYCTDAMLLEQAEASGEPWPCDIVQTLEQGSPDPTIAMSKALLLSIRECGRESRICDL